jgi:DeoR/GlpR family transcriptional regulator of sugar metabolism
MDSSKIGKILPFTFAKLTDFNYVINDGRLPEEFLDNAAYLGVEVL